MTDPFPQPTSGELAWCVYCKQDTDWGSEEIFRFGDREPFKILYYCTRCKKISRTVTPHRE